MSRLSLATSCHKAAWLGADTEVEKGRVVFEGDSPTLRVVRQVLLDPTQANEWAEVNYQLAKRYFSFTVLERRLQSILADCLGQQV